MADPNNGPILKNEQDVDLEIAEIEREINRNAPPETATAPTVDENDNAFTGNSTQAQTQRLQSEESGSGNYSSVSNSAQGQETEEEQENKKSQNIQLLNNLIDELNDLRAEIGALEDLIEDLDAATGLEKDIKELESDKDALGGELREQEGKVNAAEETLTEAERSLAEARQARESANILHIEHDINGVSERRQIFGDGNGGFYVEGENGEYVEITDPEQIAAINEALENGTELANEHEQECHKCEGKVNEARERLNQEKEHLSGVKDKIAKINNDLGSKQEKLNELNDKIEAQRESLGLSGGSNEDIKREAEEILAADIEKAQKLEEQIGKLENSSSELKGLASKMKETIGLGAKDPSLTKALEALEEAEQQVLETVSSNDQDVLLLENQILMIDEGLKATQNAREVISEYQDQTRGQFLADHLTLFSVSEGSWLDAITHPLQDEDGNLVYSDDENRLYRMEENPETEELERVYYDPEADPAAYAKLMEQAWAGDPPKMFANESLFSKDPTNTMTLQPVGNALVICDKLTETCKRLKSNASDELKARVESKENETDQDGSMEAPELTPDEGQMAIDQHKNAIASAIAGSGGSITEATLKEIALSRDIPESYIGALATELMEMDPNINIIADPLTPTIFDPKSTGPKQTVADLNADAAPHATHTPICGASEHGHDHANKGPEISLSQGFEAAASNNVPKPEAPNNTLELTNEPAVSMAMQT